MVKRQWFIKRWFLQGLVITTPLILTFILLFYSVVYVDDALISVLNLLPESIASLHFPGLGILVVLLLTTIIGSVAESWIMNRAVSAFNSVMSRLPVIRSVYQTIAKIIKGLLGDKDGIQAAVMIEYPRKGIYSLAFKTGVTEIDGKKLVTLFLPTTPNPTSGFYLMLPEDQVVTTDLTREQAFKQIVSAGMIKN